MKTKFALLAGLAAVALSTPAFADDIIIRITGSTAMRSQINATLTTATPTGLGYTLAAWTTNSAGAATGAKYHVYTKGTTPNKITILTSWSGSVAGIQAAAQNLTGLKWLPEATADITGTLGESTAVADNTNKADIAFSDVWQKASVFNTPLLTDTIVGVVQFRWVTSYGSPITNITPQQARVLYETGKLPLSFFTGNTPDASTFVYATGRDPDSGTRVTAFAETGLGTNPTVIQHKATLNTVTGAVDEIYPYAATTLFGIPLVQGNTGESSGGNLAAFFRYNTSSVPVKTAAGGSVVTAAAPVHFIGYLGTSDAATATAAASGVQNPGVIVGYNGVNPSSSGTALADAIKRGNYHFWSYLHAMHNGITGDKATFYTDLTTVLKGTAASNIKLTDMLVERFSDGGPIYKK